jgi:hypothetical protein
MNTLNSVSKNSGAKHSLQTVAMWLFGDENSSKGWIRSLE